MMRVLVAIGAIVLGLGAAAAQPLTGNIAIHDPSIAVLADGMVSFATGVENASDGGQVRTKSSVDGINWQEAGALPGGLPDWIADELGYTPKNLWAPSVFAAGGKHYLYYSASSFGRNDSAIGLMTNPSLDAANPALGWQDEGMVLRSSRSDNYNAIDPFRIDADERAWLAFGSFWDGIRLVELDPESGKTLPDAPILPLASRGGGAIEAPAILQREGKFYLFVSFDSCCRGIASTYRIMVGRSDSVTGPYVDASGQSMLAGGGTELVKSTGKYRGPGGQEVFDKAGEPWLVFHYYDRDQGGVPKLYLAPIEWVDGWPSIVPLQ